MKGIVAHIHYAISSSVKSGLNQFDNLDVLFNAISDRTPSFFMMSRINGYEAHSTYYPFGKCGNRVFKQKN